MKNTLLIITLSIFSIAGIASLTSAADSGKGSSDRGSKGSDGGWIAPRPDVNNAQSTMYQDECGACHFAYQPGLLPQASWARVMGNLEDHFGDDASLDAQQSAQIRKYLLTYAADVSSKSRSRAFASGPVSAQALPRISNTQYFRREHSEIPTRLVEDNPDVGSFSNCQACHQTAAEGIYNERNVRIPGAPGWSD